MNVVSSILELRKTLTKLPQIPHGLLQGFTAMGQVHGMFYEFGFGGQTTFREFEGKTSA